MKNVKWVFSVLCALYPVIAMSQAPVNLQPGKTRNMHIKKGEEQVYSLVLPKGKSYRIHLEQKGMDIALHLRNREGSEIAYMDSPNGMYGPEKIEISVQKDSVFTLVVEPLADPANASRGKYSLKVTVLEEGDAAVDRVLTPKEMKEDLDVFHQIREKANSGFYRYRTRHEMDSLYSWAYSAVQTEMSTTAFYKIIMTLTDFEGSNHNGTRLPFAAFEVMDTTKGYFPYFLKWVDGKMRVNYKGGEVPLGSEIVSINDIPAPELRKRFYKYFPTDGYNLTAKEILSTENAFGYIFPFELGVKDSVQVEYQFPGSLISQTIRLKTISRYENIQRYYNRYSAPPDDLLDYEYQDKYSFRMLNDSTALLNFRIFTMAANASDPQFTVFSNFLDSIFTMFRAKHINHLVIDIRNNPGGNDPTYEKVFTYLTGHSFRENKQAFILFNKTPYLHYYNLESDDRSNRKRTLNAQDEYLRGVFSVKKDGYFFQHPDFNPPYEPDSNRFRGKLYLVINENVGSAASHFASLVRGWSDATIVGMETSGGYYGHNGHYPVEYVLPNSGIITRFSIVHVDQDAPKRTDQPIGRGIIPDYTVPVSFSDFMNHEDSQLKFVLKLIEGE